MNNENNNNFSNDNLNNNPVPPAPVMNEQPVESLDAVPTPEPALAPVVETPAEAPVINEVPSSDVSPIQNDIPIVNEQPIINDPFVTNNQSVGVEPILEPITDLNNNVNKKKGPNIVVILIVILLVAGLGFGAYYYFVLNSDSAPSNNDVENDTTNEDNDVSEDNTDVPDNNTVDTDITLDDVMNAPVSPESDFEFVEIEGGTLEVDHYKGEGGIVVIPDEVDGMKVTHIDTGAFDGEDTITAVRLGDNIEIIQERGFYNAKNLQYFISGERLEEIGGAAFSGCSSLIYMKLNLKLEKIASSAFAFCDKLLELEIPSSVTSLSGSPIGGMSEEFKLIVTNGSYAHAYFKDSVEDLGIELEIK